MPGERHALPERVARLYELPLGGVRHAISFEKQLAA
jgi:hypothetical protein